MACARRPPAPPPLSLLAILPPPPPSPQIKIDLGELDITTDLVNFDEIDDDLERFQQDEIVREALEKVRTPAFPRGEREG